MYNSLDAYSLCRLQVGNQLFIIHRLTKGCTFLLRYANFLNILLQVLTSYGKKAGYFKLTQTFVSYVSLVYVCNLFVQHISSNVISP